jgi:plastocyanin
MGLGMACGGGGDGGGGGNGPQLSIAKGGAPNGDAQTGVVLTALADSLVVIVQEDGAAKAGVTVGWSAQGVGASVSPVSSITDANGRAATSWTVGQVAGAQTARATVAGATGSPVTFNAVAAPGAPDNIAKVSGDGQAGTINLAFTAPLGVRIADQHGNGIAGITVDWVVQSGPVALSGGTTSVTNAAGLATKSVTAGATGGAAVVRASSTSVGNQVDFNLTVAQAPVRVTLGSNFFQSDRNNSSDPAVDTTTVGRPVVWTGTGGTHTVESTGSPSFASSGNLTGNGATYSVTFTDPGTYQYDCNIHPTEMSGRIVVQP